MPLCIGLLVSNVQCYPIVSLLQLREFSSPDLYVAKTELGSRSGSFDFRSYVLNYYFIRFLGFYKTFIFLFCVAQAGPELIFFSISAYQVLLLVI